MSVSEQVALLKTDARPSLTLRVGITGHRNLGPDSDQIEVSAGLILDEIHRAIQSIAKEKPALELYAVNPPIIQLTSSLAEGADRIIARQALSRGWRLVAALPFSSPEYEKDFVNTVEEFRALVAQAIANGGAVVELDGDRDSENSGYYDAGRFVLDHSDLLIAIWDGEPARGPGGTGQIVALAIQMGIPVVQLLAQPPRSFVIYDSPDKDVSAKIQTAGAPIGQIPVLVERILVPRWAKLDDEESRTLHHAARKYLVREHLTLDNVSLDFLGRGPFRPPATVLGRVFPIFTKALAFSKSVKSAGRQKSLELPPFFAHATVRDLQLHFHRADVLATHFANVHRSAFVTIYILGALALIGAAVSLTYGRHKLGSLSVAGLGTGFELICLLGILGLVTAEKRKRWRERWLDYRLLAELLRHADLHAQMRGTLSPRDLYRIGEDQPSRQWVCWLAASICRAAGIVGIRYDKPHLEQIRDYTANVRLADQIEYHSRTEKRNHLVSHQLRLLSEMLFFATLTMVVIKLAIPGYADVIQAGFLASLFPSIAAASFGIRNQAEFEIIASRSNRISRRLQRQSNIIKALGSALLSGTLAQEITNAARIMIDDTVEWSAIFNVKESETT